MAVIVTYICISTINCSTLLRLIFFSFSVYLCSPVSAVSTLQIIMCKLSILFDCSLHDKSRSKTSYQRQNIISRWIYNRIFSNFFIMKWNEYHMNNSQHGRNPTKQVNIIAYLVNTGWLSQPHIWWCILIDISEENIIFYQE